MNCRRVRDHLSRFVEGELSAREEARIVAHLRDCSACGRVHETLATFEQEVRGLARSHPVPPGFRRRCVDRWITERENGRTDGKRRFLLFPVTLRLALPAVVALGLFLALFGRGAGLRENPSETGAPWERGRPARMPALPDAGGTPALPAPMPRALSAAAPSVRQGPGERPGGTVFLPAPAHRMEPQEGFQVAATTAPYRRPERNNPSPLEALNRDPIRDDFVTIPLPRLVDESGRQIAAAAEARKREVAIVDERLARKVTLQFKATALSDLCDALRADTGIHLSAGSSVADEKVTLFCTQMPLRDLMRQLSRPFGYAWSRGGKEGKYRYELYQDLKSQLVEEDLRNRDRNAALLAVDQEMQRYRPYLGISPQEARARLANAAPAEKPLLEHLARAGWGPVQIYFRLSPRDHDALRAGQRLTFSAAPESGEQPLPADLERGVMETMDTHRVQLQDGRYQSMRVENLPQGLLPAAVPEARAHVGLNLFASELGQFMLGGSSGFKIAGWGGPTRGDVLATGVSPAVTKPNNEAANARWRRHAALKAIVTLEPRHGCSSSPPHAKAAAADLLEALHRATGLPIVADAYTRLHSLEEVTIRNRPLFAALNHVADTMRLRWSREGEWLQFRSTSYFHDRLKEVPNRLLTRLAAARREQKILSFDDLLSVAQLSDEQLQATSMAEGARECYGLAEWDLPRDRLVRSHLRIIAEFSPSEREQAQRAEGLPFTQLTLSQQQRVLSLLMGPALEQVRSLEELTGTVIRVDYATPGGFRWAAADNPDMPIWITLPRLFARASTRAEALMAARRIDPSADETQIIPSEAALAVIYRMGPLTRLSPSVIRAWSRGVRFSISRPLPPDMLDVPAAGP